MLKTLNGPFIIVTIDAMLHVWNAMYLYSARARGLLNNTGCSTKESVHLRACVVCEREWKGKGTNTHSRP